MPWAATRSKAARPPPLDELRQDADALAAAGCFAVVLEGVPDALAERITAELDVADHRDRRRRRPATGRSSCCTTCSGWLEGEPARFVRRYAELGQDRHRSRGENGPPTSGRRAIPSDAESYHASPSCARRSRSAERWPELQRELGARRYHDPPAQRSAVSEATRRTLPACVRLGYHVAVPYTPAPSRCGAPSAERARVRRR